MIEREWEREIEIEPAFSVPVYYPISEFATARTPPSTEFKSDLHPNNCGVNFAQNFPILIDCRNGSTNERIFSIQSDNLHKLFKKFADFIQKYTLVLYFWCFFTNCQKHSRSWKIKQVRKFHPPKTKNLKLLNDVHILECMSLCN